MTTHADNNQSILTLNAKTMGCGGCAAKIEKALQNISGIHQTRFDLKNKQITITFSEPADSATLIQLITQTGYPVEPAQ